MKELCNKLLLNFIYVITLLYRTYVAVCTFWQREGDTRLPHYESNQKNILNIWSEHNLVVF